jgi:2-keto-4-pentenoate hydratase/2-oxohepta-3-ene-1,7-dioic acid hydratase in catechol pathway
MRLASFRHGEGNGFGVVEGNSVFDVSGHFPGLGLRDLLDRPERIFEAKNHGKVIAFDAIEWLPPVPDPGRIFCVGRNFRRAMESLGLSRPDYPILFTRFASSQVGHQQAIVRPTVSRQFDYEGELCVVVGRSGRHIPEADALAHVAGYTCYNDGSVRDYQRHTSQDTPGKNFWRSGATGPWIVTADTIPDPSQLTLRTTVNGETVQSDRLDDLLFSVPQVLAYLSRIAPLEPGDLVALGTPLGSAVNRTPQRWLEPGDEVSIIIDGIGTLTNRVVDEADVAESH